MMPVADKSEKPTGPRASWRTRLAWIFVVIGSPCLALYLARAPLLAGAARAWIVDDALAPADAIAVLGGGAQFRTFAAARLYHAGVAPRIAFMDVGLGTEERERGQTVSGETRMLRAVLLSERVPEDNIVLVGRGETSTAEEARALRDWAVKSGVKRLLIPTDFFHTRRVSSYFRKVFAGTGIETRVQAVPMGGYTPDNWWQNEDGVISFQNEVIKSALYLARR